MANPEHVDRLLQGVEAWNRWREESHEVPDLFGADFNHANLQEVDLKEADLRYTNFHHADLSESKLFGAKLKGANLSKTNLYKTSLAEADLNGANLNGANLVKANFLRASLNDADLSGANLSEANLTYANLGGANLSDVDLYKAAVCAVQALDTNFNGAMFTGACIQDWNINAQTNLQDVVCEYIFTTIKYDFQSRQFSDRRPHDPNQIFAPGEFTKRYQIVLETVDLFFNDGIDWKAFLDSLQDLKTEYGEELNLQGIEKKAGGSFVVRLEVPSDVDKGTIERTAKVLYETKLEILEAKYHAELQAKDREIEIYKQKSADILELAKLAASRPIHVEAKAVAENQSSSESYTNNFSNSPIGNFANKMQDQASQQTNQYIGANLNEITTLIQSLRSQAESFPEAQRTEAIDHIEEVEIELKQPPEKRKPSRMKAALSALLLLATSVSGAVSNTNEFVGQVQELSEKLGIELSIAHSQSEKAIDVQTIDSEQP